MLTKRQAQQSFERLYSPGNGLMCLSFKREPNMHFEVEWVRAAIFKIS